MEPTLHEDAAAWAEAIRQACLAAALHAWEDAGVQGLCMEGRWEAAVGAIRQLPLPPPPSGAESGQTRTKR